MPYRLTNIRVLIIDENPPVRLLMRSLLLDLGIGMIDMAAHAEQGWDFYNRFRPDMIVLDWPATDRTALDFIQRVRNHPDSPLPHVPIIVVTGHSPAERVKQIRDAGASDLIIKPFTMHSLVSHLIHIVETPRAFVRTPYFVGPDRRRRDHDITAERRSSYDDSEIPTALSAMEALKGKSDML
ncbi:MAG TPA: response regulator [Alphaproteobacteria bacterium]